MGDEQERELLEAEPLLRDFYEGWHAAADLYATYPEKTTAEHDATAAANCVRCHMSFEVSRRFDDRPGCTLKDVRGLKLLIHKDTQVWRFKKVDKDGRHSNYPTQQQEDFDDQLALPGLPERATHLTSGYMLDASGKALERVVVSRVLGRDVCWVVQTVVVDGTLKVRDITPNRLPGTEPIDFDVIRARQRRGRR